MITPHAAGKRVVVRAPFRVLAAVVWVAALVALLGTGYAGWHGAPALTARDVVMVPGMLWLFRLVFHATVYGNAPANAHWPFASSQVASGYMLCVMVVQSWL